MKHAFSLIELSIVLVILGLLTGGILAGQSLIRAAELRSVTTEFNRFATATNSFRDKYFALPGDMNNATKFWGTAHATPATCATTTTNDARTCDGNGDGLINSLTTSAEYARYWQQMANAGLIEGSYTGIGSGSGDPSIIGGVNAPSGRISSSAWHVWSNYNPTCSGSSAFCVTYDTAFFYGGVAANSWPTNQNLKPEELWNIDSKMDDGLPAQGKIISTYWSGCSTATTKNDVNATYNLSSTALACTIAFRRPF